MSSDVAQTIPLELLSVGDTGRIVEIDGMPDLVVRLEEMGLHVGATVRMIRPGLPCILEVNLHRFLVRIDESAMILVEAA
jgi:Fe2+ transport system protein FeoA